MLQCNATTSAGSGSQIWQRFFFGQSTAASSPLQNNARAISVWEAGTDDDRRIAICGETRDPLVEFSQSATGWTGATAPAATGYTGFIAVYDGAGVIQWTHHFFSNNNIVGNETCAITDVSIRVDEFGRDVVTYCGIFSHGDPGAGSELSPLRPFPASPPFSGGATTQAANQYDGFVGRLVKDPGAPFATRVFHSIVGGPGQDGLFGLCEIDDNRFAVVGSTSITATTAPGAYFPAGLSTPNTDWSVGAVLVFDARFLATANLELVGSHHLGSPATAGPPPTVWDTFACDVCVGKDVLVDTPPALANMLYVVGTTNDPAFSTNPPGPGLVRGWRKGPPIGQDVLNGTADGFVAAVALIGPAGGTSLTVPWTYSYWRGGTAGGSGRSGLTGISNWNEWSDQIGVVGYTESNGASTRDIGTSTFFFNTAYGSTVGLGNTAFPNQTEQLHRIRDVVIVGPGIDTPTTLGGLNATSAFPIFTTLAEVANGGGIAIGNDGRTNVVGSSSPNGMPPGYPVVGGGRPADLGVDAVRTELDPLPRAQTGVGRTDGTGFQAGAGPYPPPPALASGGTTPACALDPYGMRVGTAAPVLPRMLIDYQGTLPAPGVSDGAIMVSRPTVQPGSFALSTLQVGLPPALPWLVLSGTEFWLGDPAASNLLMADVGQANRPLRFRLPAFPMTPPGTSTLSMQAASLLVTPIGSGTCSSLWSASPAIFFTY